MGPICFQLLPVPLIPARMKCSPRMKTAPCCSSSACIPFFLPPSTGDWLEGGHWLHGGVSAVQRVVSFLSFHLEELPALLLALMLVTHHPGYSALQPKLYFWHGHLFMLSCCISAKASALHGCRTKGSWAKVGPGTHFTPTFPVPHDESSSRPP